MGRDKQPKKKKVQFWCEQGPTEYGHTGTSPLKINSWMILLDVPHDPRLARWSYGIYSHETNNEATLHQD